MNNETGLRPDDRREDWTKEDVIEWFGFCGYSFFDYNEERITDEEPLDFKIIRGFNEIAIKDFIFIIMADSEFDGNEVVLFDLDSIDVDDLEPIMSWPIKGWLTHEGFSWETKDLRNLLYENKLIERCKETDDKAN